ncbi:hypothetical protein EBAPG3_001300 [Nitrosospira lacus]|uniref:NodB homology domain-containing protein n=1 Tax=Nitrosospira lacus TaxID=1288494 RepID=A0A1W6SL56_9PROT|nr:polysaccharide deacetylase family protein [Nitrosospira lacus]ARO86528.1 hypothetical protein EBAPG3_001300 [Nitrosospira lacus]
MSFRQMVLAVVKALGGFGVARILTAPGLRIICYHGISVHDEHRFQPKLFMREDTFLERMAYLKRHDYPVLSLNEALALMYQKSLPPRAVVITFDDGWLGTGTKAAPALREHGFPSTVYVTTRDAVNGMPVFNVALRYLIWKGRGKALDMYCLGLAPGTIVLNSPDEREHAACRISEASEQGNDQERRALLMKLAEILEVDWNPDGDNPLFRLMTMEQLAQLPAQGMNVQLHTHRHRLPIGDRDGVESEITDNRVVLERIADRPLRHLCYPSGEFHPSQFPWLRALGIESATTCLSGFNYPHTERLELRRFLDGENIAQVEFEAELSGFLELMRKFRRAVGRR